MTGLFSFVAQAQDNRVALAVGHNDEKIVVIATLDCHLFGEPELL